MIRIYFFAFLLVCIDFYVLKAQTKKELENNRIEVQKIIENTTKLLEETSKSRKTSVNQFNIVSRRLEERENIIINIEAEIGSLDNSILKGEKRINILNTELEEARESYAKLINIAYKHRFSHQVIMFILSSDNFSQAYRRFRYLQQYAQSRRKQISRIQEITDEIILELDELESKRNEKFSLLAQKQNEINLLNSEKVQHKSVLNELQDREEELRLQIQNQKQVTLSIERAIEKLIRDETKSGITETRRYELTPEERIISTEFYENKGGLPWPIQRGIVTGYFGEHSHPVLKGIKIQNNGIDIATNTDAEVRSLFRGVVRSVLTVPGANNVIIIRHGNYLSVYSNLSHVYVRRGDVVNTNQLIGRVFTDNDDSKTILHLEIWEENIKLDPIQWLSSHR